MTDYEIPAHLLIQTVRDEAVVLDPDSGDYFTLNQVASRMLQLYRESGDVDAVVTAIVTEYDVSAAVAAVDLERLFDDLVAHGLARAKD